MKVILEDGLVQCSGIDDVLSLAVNSWYGDCMYMTFSSLLNL